jgi:predicted nucleic acid-binding protein
MSHFFDTSVLIPVFLEAHEHHDRSLAIFLKSNPEVASCSSHGLAEFYATLTRLPATHRLSGAQVQLFLENIQERLTIVSLTSAETLQTLKLAAKLDIVGGALYDFFHAQCALKSGRDTILTWNTKHFTRFGTEIAKRVKTP